MAGLDKRSRPYASSERIASQVTRETSSSQRAVEPGLRATSANPGANGCAATIDGEASLAAALARLRAADPHVVDHLLEVGGPPPLRLRESGFPGLASIVVSQQVSVASASAIFGRLQAAIAPLTAEGLRDAPDAVLRGVGLSGPKIRALRAIAEAVASGALPLASLGALPAEEARGLLVAVKGVGPWTADIFLLFCLGHPDAWPCGDLALREAARIALSLESRPSTADLARLGERWRPHRGVAARLLWAYYRAVKRGRSGMGLEA